MSVGLKAPKWWFQKGHPLSYALAPVGFVYGLATRVRFAVTKSYRSTLPVVCIGNYTMGGGGKTPLAIEIATLLRDNGHKPVFLTRGYGGRIKGPHLVDPSSDCALDVGDEPLLLAQVSPVVVCADRALGARYIEGLEADVIIMDDGFQNPTLAKDLSLVVVDETVGVGNGCVFPAGPLRMGLAFQLDKTDILMIGGQASSERSVSFDAEQIFAGDILHFEIVAKGDVEWLKEARLLAMTGIARPEKFYVTLTALGANIVQKKDFPDHHAFTESEARELLEVARQDQLSIVMTKKDWVRLSNSGECGRLRHTAKVLEIDVQINHPQQLLARLEKAISSSASRHSG